METDGSHHITKWLRQTFIPSCDSSEPSPIISIGGDNVTVVHFPSDNGSGIGDNYNESSSFNYYDESFVPEWVPTYSSDIQVLIILIAYAFSFILSFCGNCLAIVIFVRFDCWPKDLRILLTNISVAGLLSAVLCLPFTLLYQLLQSWVFSGPLCRILTFLQLAATIGTILTHLAIGLNRLWVIVYPLKARTFQVSPFPYLHLHPFPTCFKFLSCLGICVANC